MLCFTEFLHTEKEKPKHFQTLIFDYTKQCKLEIKEINFPQDVLQVFVQSSCSLCWAPAPELPVALP